MKRILILLFILMSTYINAQVIGADVVNFTAKTEIQMNAITVAQGLQHGSVCYRSDTNSLWRYNGTTWAEMTGGGGLQSTDIDTFAELDAIVADATLAKSGDNVSIFTNDAGYLSSSSLNSLSGNLLPSANNTYTIGSAIAVWSQLFAGIHTGNKFYWRTNYGGSGTNMNGDMVSSSLWSLSPNINSVSENMDLSYNYTTNEWTINGDRILTTADGAGGSSPPFDDTTSLVQDPVDGTKEVRIDAGNVPTGTTVTLTAPSSDLNLANVVVGPASATNSAIALFDGTTGKLLKNSTVAISSGSLSGVQSISFTGTNANISLTPTDTEPTAAEGKIYSDNSENRPKYHDGTSWKAFLLSGDATDDQIASEVNITDAAGYYTGTDVEAMGQEIGADLADRPTSLGTGRTNAVQYSDVFGQTLADYNTDGAGGAGDLIIITDASPAEVVTTATIAMDGWKMYDDQTADAATITLSDCDPGETLTVYINRASAPTLAGTGLTFNQLPNTTAFASATQMMIIFEVAYDGTTIDYYYVER